jgi:hypothetical protein
MLDPVPIAAGTYHIAHDQSTTEARFWGTNDPGVTSSQFAHDVAMPFPDPAAASSQYASATWSEFVLVAQ